MLNAIGLDYNYVAHPIDAWATIIIMDVWHWTSLVALLCYAGLKSIPDAYYQAAQIDGASRWAVFAAIQLPKLKRVLLIAILLRFMDSFMIYTEPFVVTGGGPGNTTTFISIELVKLALGQFDLGKAAAMSVVFNLIILITCWVFYTVMTNAGQRAQSGSRERAMTDMPGRRIVLALFIIFLLLPIYWLINMSFKTNTEIVTTMTLWPHRPTLENYRNIFTDESWYSGYINSLKYVVLNTLISVSTALPAAYAFSRYRFIGDKHLFFWLLTNRMAPPAVFALPFFNLYSAIGLFDTPWAVALAHCLFNVPLAVWILEGFMSERAARDRRDRVPRRLFVSALLRQDLHAADRERHRRRGVLLLHVLVGRAAAGAHVDLGQRQADLRDDDTHRVCRRHGLGPARRRRRADNRAWRLGDLVRPQLHRARLRARPGLREGSDGRSAPGWHGRRRPRAVLCGAGADCSP